MQTSELKNKLNNSLEHFKSELSTIRTGRATPALIENVLVNAYESKMTIKELGSITIPDSQMIVISAWDKSLLKEIAGAIRESDLKLNPVVEGDTVKVPLPPLTEERRKEFTKLVSTKTEECKSSIRNVRQDAMKDIDKEFASKEIGEDEKFSKRKNVEEIVKEFVDRVDELAEYKKKSILEI